MMSDKAQAAGPRPDKTPGSSNRPELCHSSTPREACTNNAFLTSTSRFRSERSPEPRSHAIHPKPLTAAYLQLTRGLGARERESGAVFRTVPARIRSESDILSARHKRTKWRSRSLLCSVRIRLAPDGGGMAQVRGNGMECDRWGHTSVGLIAISVGSSSLLRRTSSDPRPSPSHEHHKGQTVDLGINRPKGDREGERVKPLHTVVVIRNRAMTASLMCEVNELLSGQESQVKGLGGTMIFLS